LTAFSHRCYTASKEMVGPLKGIKHIERSSELGMVEAQHSGR